jgi:hypothetical protein
MYDVYVWDGKSGKAGALFSALDSDKDKDKDKGIHTCFEYGGSG